MERTGGTVPAVHTSPCIFGNCNGLDVHLSRQMDKLDFINGLPLDFVVNVEMLKFISLLASVI